MIIEICQQSNDRSRMNCLVQWVEIVQATFERWGHLWTTLHSQLHPLLWAVLADFHTHLDISSRTINLILLLEQRYVPHKADMLPTLELMIESQPVCQEVLLLLSEHIDSESIFVIT